MDIDILIYVEDPGAANYVAHIPSALEKDGLSVQLFAEGFAYKHLFKQGVQANPVPRPVTADNLLSRLRPKQVIVGTSENPETFGFDLICAASKLGISTVGIVDASGNSEYRFRGNTGNPLHYAPDWLIVPDQWTKDAYVSLGYPSGKIAACGHPHFDHVYDTRTKLEVIGRSKLRKRMFPYSCKKSTVMVFVSEVSTGLNPDQYKKSSYYTLKGRGDRTDRTGIVLEEFLDAVKCLKKRPYLVLRMHPKNSGEDLAPFRQEFDQVSQQESPLEIVYAADLIVGMTTMLLQEAAIMGRQTLSILPRAVESRSLPTIRAGITPCVTTRKEIREILPDLLKEGKSNIDHNIEALFHYGSLSKAVAFIENLLTERSS